MHIVGRDMRVVTGNAHPALAKAVCDALGIGLSEVDVGRFPDGETKVKILEDVRGRDCFVIQSTCPPVNDHLMELLIMIDALRRSSAARVTAVIPYFGYARQDRKHEGRVPITAKLVSNMISNAGVDRVLCMDLHATQIQGFFDIPLDHLYAWPVLVDYIKKMELADVCFLSPDPGRMKLAEKFADRVGGEIAVIDKRRIGDSDVGRGHVVGDILGKSVFIIDDMISTAGTISQAAHVAVECGAKEVYTMATHPVFCGRAFERLNGMPVKELVVCDTIPMNKRPEKVKIVVLSVASLLAEAIKRTHLNESISMLFA